MYMITNKHFTDEQIEKYASAFKEGDAIWRGGRWHEVKSLVKAFDFVGSGGTIRRVTTLEHYKLQGGEKIVWLGKSDSRKHFSECFYVIRYNGSLIYQNKVGYTLVYGDDWGIIPSYEQVKNLNKTTITEKVNQTVKEKNKRELSPYEQIANEHNITKEELSFILDECDNGRKNYIINCLISLRSKWHENN